MKQRVVFLAVTAPPSADKFGLERLGIEVDRTAKEGIECLEGDLGQMMPTKLAQHTETRLTWSSVADAGEVRRQITTGAHRVKIRRG